MLSKYELELVTDPQIILTKNRIIAKVYEMFGSLSSMYVTASSDVLPAGLLSVSPKIARGENYLGLPYVMLDYPRNFSRHSVLAVRTFFWWGNFFSITLHLSGTYVQQYVPKIQAAINNKRLQGWYLSNGESEWEHHFEVSNYRLIDQDVVTDRGMPFIKVASRIHLLQWQDAPAFLQQKYNELIKIIS